MKRLIAKIWLSLAAMTFLGGFVYFLYQTPEACLPLGIIAGGATFLILTLWACSEVLDD
jgi:hypothetical protein